MKSGKTILTEGSVLVAGVFMLMSFNTRIPDKDSIYFYSLNRAIQLGQYDRVTTAAELKKNADFGIGSEEELSSELVMVDGVCYSIPANGQAEIMNDTAGIAFAATKKFKSDKRIELKDAIDFSDLIKLLDKEINLNLFAAIKIKGTFSEIKYRSFYAQPKPYKPLKKVKQAEFSRTTIKATCVGFFTPSSAAVLNNPGYHLHFISDDKATGGHITDLKISNVVIEIDYADKLEIKMGDPSIYKRIELDKPIKKKEIKRKG